VEEDARAVSLGLDMQWSGAAGAGLVAIFTVVYTEVREARQRGRELRGLARVIRPKMERNSDAIDTLKHAGLDPATYRDEHPTRDAWYDTRVRLSQLMKDEDFHKLAMFYDDLEMLDVTINNTPVMAEAWLTAAASHMLPAMRVVDGYCDARWRVLKEWTPADL
jgi:hypothetical protein